MKILGRSPDRFGPALLELPHHLVAAVRCARTFRDAGSVLSCYLRGKNPRSRQVQLRNGVVLHLSNDDSDIVTVYLIFCRLDYGTISAGTSVIDVGSNIGIFAVHAAVCGAASVHAFEPAEESFALLQRNVAANGFEAVITPHRGVVVGRPRSPVMFPRKSSVFNRLDGALAASDSESMVEVDAIHFAEAVGRLRSPSLIKMDCEGSEYEIIEGTDAASFARIDEMRMEYHEGPRDRLVSRLAEMGFECLRLTDDGEGSGYLWVRKKPLE